MGGLENFQTISYAGCGEYFPSVGPGKKTQLFNHYKTIFQYFIWGNIYNAKHVQLNKKILLRQVNLQKVLSLLLPSKLVCYQNIEISII